MNGPVVKISIMDIIEEDLCVELVCSIDSIEMHHFLHTAIPVHIPRLCILDYPVFQNVVVKILGVVFCLVNYHKWNESLAIRSG